MHTCFTLVFLDCYKVKKRGCSAFQREKNILEKSILQRFMWQHLPGRYLFLALYLELAIPTNSML